jgi:sugar phosphate isomerase/epimerase
MPQRSRALSLAALTVLELAPPEMVSCAASAGFSHVGLRLIPATPQDRRYPVIGETPMVRDIRARLAADGVDVLDVEVFRLKDDTRIEDFVPAIETAASLGGKHLLTTGQDPDRGRLRDNFAALCALAGRYGLTVDLEFMRWTEIATLAQARDIVGACGADNAGIIVDALHFDRTRTTLEELRAVPAQRLHFAQICDAPAAMPPTMEAVIHEARTARMAPGAGELDLVSFIRALPPLLPLSVEVPMATRAPALDRARSLRDAALSIIGASRRAEEGA